jgi:cellulose synthase operon protein C
MSDRNAKPDDMDPATDLHALTARYFDGELSSAEEEQALEHLAGCAQCQAELGDLVGIEVALQRPGETNQEAPEAPVASDAPAVVAPVMALAADPSPLRGGEQPASATIATAKTKPEPEPDAAPIPLDPARRRRAAGARRFLAPAVGLALAAAAVLLWVRARRDAAEPPQLALAASRGVEARFSSAPFSAHRPYEVVRGAAGREEISLSVLAELERRGDRFALAAAQALRGEVVQATAVLSAAPASAERESDLAALELVAGRPEEALAAADRAIARAPEVTAAHWNRALALRELGLSLIAAAAFEEVSRRGEAGWSDEAKAKANALRAQLAERAPRAAAFNAAARAMIERKGPPLSTADAAAHPGLTRLYFHDALRTAASVEEARALEPLARALDAAAGNQLAAGAVAQVAAADFTVRRPLALAYRELLAGRAAGGGPALWSLLGEAATYVEDLRLGTAMLGFAGVSPEEVARLIEATGDPWFSLHLPRERARTQLAAGAADLAETELRTALASCDERLWAFRCARLAHDLMSLYISRTRYREAEQAATQAVRLFDASGASELADVTLRVLAETHRGRGRFSLAAATFQEVIARLGDSDCSATRYARSGLTLLSIYRSATLGGLSPPAADDCQQPPSAVEMGSMVDLALMTGEEADRARARTWIAAARGAGDPRLTLLAEVADARLALEREAAAAARLMDSLRQLTGSDEATGAFRAWIYQTLIDDAARRGAWTEVMAKVAEELGVTAPASCALAVSLDDNRGTAVALGGGGAPTGARSSVTAPPDWTGAVLVPAALRDALAGCAQVAVLARPPLHGRADLLPPELPWAFVGPRAATPPPAPGPARELFVGDALPPAALALPALAPMASHAGAAELRGAAATPTSVLAALGDATYAELHVHGQVDLGVADASFLALSPDAGQRWALTAAEVRTARLAGAPVVVLAACRAAQVAPFEHKRWSLPDAFLEAGARAVIAPTVEVPDSEAAAFFAELRARLAAGDEVSAALAALRRAYLERGAAWAASVILFR